VSPELPVLPVLPVIPDLPVLHQMSPHSFNNFNKLKEALKKALGQIHSRSYKLKSDQLVRVVLQVLPVPLALRASRE